MKRIPTVIIIGLLCFSMVSMLAPQTRAPGLPPVGYWEFDEDSGTVAQDSSGNGNDGVIHTATWTDGIIGKALHFNGVDSWVEVPNSPTLTGLSQITVEAWIQEDSIPSRPNGIISKCDGCAPPTNAEYFLGTVDNGRVFFETDHGTAIFSDQTTPLITEVGRWYHVAGTWSGDAYTMYVDGVPVLSGTCTPQTTLSNTLPVQIGRHGTWSWVYFQGIVDEVKIYNYARTAQDILNDYNSAPQGPIAYWKFDEGSGSIAHDSSENGNDGTLISGPQWVDGVRGKALKFDGVDDSVYVADSSSLDITGTQMSVEYWIELPGGWQAGMPKPVDIYVKGDAWVGSMNSATGKHRFNFAYFPNPYPETNRNSWDANTWYFIADVYDGSYIRMYVNGVLDVAAACSGAITVTNEHFEIGGGYGWPWFFNGTIDELAIYNYARTAEDILSDYNSVSRVHVDVSAVSVTIGQTFDVAMRVSNVADLYLWVFSVHWNPTILEYVSIAEGDFLGRGGSTTGVLVKSVNETGGYLEEATCSLLGAVPGVDGDGILATITFRAIGLGSSPVGITFHDFIDSNGSSIQSYSVDGNVNVIGPDLSIAEIDLPYPTLAKYANTTMPVNITIQNTGTADAGTFNVSFAAYWNDGGLLEHYEEQRVASLETSATITLYLHFTPYHSGSYTLTFSVDCNDEVTEANETNNQLSLPITVNIQGDITGDGQVRYQDLFVLSRAYWSYPSDPNWNPSADLNYDGVVDYRDLFLLSKNYSS